MGTEQTIDVNDLYAIFGMSGYKKLKLILKSR